ncbi:MAG: zf-HC2 domain-containing protein [Longimicrobiales bacterium]
MNDEWTDRISEYLDGDLAEADRVALETHLARCDACRATVIELRAVIQKAAVLPHYEPAHDLWDGIFVEIRTPADSTVVPFPHKAGVPSIGEGELDRSTAAGHAGRRRRFSLSMPQLAAAGFAIMAVSAGSMWLTLRAPADQDAPVAQAPAEGVAEPTSTRLVSTVEQNYDAAIGQLEGALAATRAQLDPRTVAVIERNLQIIDAAIMDARAALAADPNDVDLYRYLDDTLMKKIDLLRRATTLGRAQT